MDRTITRIWADYRKLYFEDGSYIHVSPVEAIIQPNELSNKHLPRGLYIIYLNSGLGFDNPLLYLEEYEWYQVDENDILHFIGYTTDEFIRENITRRINSL